MTSFALNIGTATGKRIKKRRKNLGEVRTPGKKRKRPCPVLDKLESFEADKLKRLFKSFYEENNPPTSEMLRKRYNSDMGTVISKPTFKKWIRGLNYRYKKINNRAVMVQLEHVVVKRGFYLKKKIANVSN